MAMQCTHARNGFASITQLHLVTTRVRRVNRMPIGEDKNLFNLFNLFKA